MYDSFIEKWVLFAMRRGVKQLYLDFPSYWDPDYKLPEWLFKCERLISLSPTGIDVAVPNFVCFSSLISLTITNVLFMKVDSIPALLDGCPLLEDLVLEESEFFGGGVLRTSSSSTSGLLLKRLTIASNSICVTEEEVGLEIEAPKLQILNLSWFKK
eukprot:TRINITY_DN4258_c1_g3_i2.p1 TRINITY_DN4258_c1_g3~~TRINITY_DN4258_c1_g3_i2.p1  ORF type:complete len:157 (-),score=24.72 TRINITY_DN4258_c1_g3_i2:298-768(-)